MNITAFVHKGLSVFGVLILLGMASPSPSIIEKGPADLEVFVKKGCPHCESAKKFLASLQQEYPELKVIFQDVGKDPEARDRLKHLASKFGIKPIGVPAFFVKGKLIFLSGSGGFC